MLNLAAMLPAVILSFFLSWVQVSSDTYVIKSSAGEDAAKRVLRQLEGFHQLVGSFVFRSTQLPELPIEVLLIGDEATLKELAPVYQGRKIDVAGYYQRGQDRDFIVLSGRERARNLTGIAYHELTHYFVSRALVNRPAWLSEGLAEYFSTADIRNDRIVLGALSPERLQLLRTERLLPLEQLFAVDSNSPYYNEGRKANVFYAESWAFIYYMMHGDYASTVQALHRGVDEIRSKNLLDYLKVKPNELESEFTNYLRLIVQRSRNTTVRINTQTPSMKVETIPDAQAQISMAEIFLASGDVVQARHYFEIANTTEGELPRASYYAAFSHASLVIRPREISSTRWPTLSLGHARLCSWCSWANCIFQRYEVFWNRRQPRTRACPMSISPLRTSTRKKCTASKRRSDFAGPPIPEPLSLRVPFPRSKQRCPGALTLMAGNPTRLGN